MKPEGASLITLAMAINKLEVTLTAQRLAINDLHKQVTKQAKQITVIFGSIPEVEKE